MYVVRHLYEVVYFAVALDDSLAHHGSVNGGVGTYLNVIFYDDLSYLWYFVIYTLCIGFESKAIGSYDCAAMQDAVFSNDAVVVYFAS